MDIHGLKWDIHPDKMEAYAAWVEKAIPSILAFPDLAEFRGYRPGGLAVFNE